MGRGCLSSSPTSAQSFTTWLRALSCRRRPAYSRKYKACFRVKACVLLRPLLEIVLPKIDTGWGEGTPVDFFTSAAQMTPRSVGSNSPLSPAQPLPSLLYFPHSTSTLGNFVKCLLSHFHMLPPQLQCGIRRVKKKKNRSCSSLCLHVNWASTCRAHGGRGARLLSGRAGRAAGRLRSQAAIVPQPEPRPAHDTQPRCSRKGA